MAKHRRTVLDRLRNRFILRRHETAAGKHSEIKSECERDKEREIERERERA